MIKLLPKIEILLYESKKFMFFHASTIYGTTWGCIELKLNVWNLIEDIGDNVFVNTYLLYFTENELLINLSQMH